MRSLRGIELLSSRHHLNTLSTQWAVGARSSTFVSSGVRPLGVHVDTADKREVKSSRQNGLLRSSFEPRRNGGSSRLKRVRVKGVAGGWVLPSLEYNGSQVREQAVLTSEGPSCIFVGPLDTAEKAELEALYQQVRNN
jgi:hypothetical protein